MTPPPAHRVRCQREALEDSLLRMPQDASHSLALSRSLDRLINHALRVRRSRFAWACCFLRWASRFSRRLFISSSCSAMAVPPVGQEFGVIIPHFPP